MDIEKALQMAVKVAAGFQPIDTNSAICRLAEEVLDLRTALASAKEEIERLTADNCKPAEDVCELCQPLTDMHARAEAAESLLASERKETERLREDIAELKAERDRWWAKAVGRVVELNNLYRILEQMDAMDIYQPITAQESEMRKLVSGVLANRKAALQSRQGEE